MSSCLLSLVYFIHFFSLIRSLFVSFFFFFNDTATTEIYTLSLHDALPISSRNLRPDAWCTKSPMRMQTAAAKMITTDRKSTRLNSSHGYISYAVFCLKKKKKKKKKKVVNNINKRKRTRIKYDIKGEYNHTT